MFHVLCLSAKVAQNRLHMFLLVGSCMITCTLEATDASRAGLGLGEVTDAWRSTPLAAATAAEVSGPRRACNQSQAS